MGHDGTFDHHQPKRGGSAMKITTVGIDLAKDIFRVEGCDARDRVCRCSLMSRVSYSPLLLSVRPSLSPRLDCGETDGASYFPSADFCTVLGRHTTPRRPFW